MTMFRKRPWMRSAAIARSGGRWRLWLLWLVEPLTVLVAAGALLAN